MRDVNETSVSNTCESGLIPESRSRVYRKRIVLFGIGDLARIAKLYFERDTDYEPACFTVDREYMPSHAHLLGLPVVPYDEVLHLYPPATHEAHVCLIYNQMNRCRANICARMEKDGYAPASYRSPRAFVAPTAKLGRHHFIFENNVIQDFVEIGDNCIFWSGNHVGHSSKIGNDCFISSHVVISGHCDIGNNCFVGVNSTLANNTVLGKESWVMPGAIMSGVLPPNSFVKTIKSEWAALNERALNWALERNRR